MPLRKIPGPVRVHLRLAGLLAVLVAGGCGLSRPALSPSELAMKAQDFERREVELDEVQAQTLADRIALKRRQAGDPDQPVQIEVLALSSGGQYGAFGVGVLQGWGEVKDPTLARPEFDVVTGVSTGAIMAPYAFVGTPDAIGRIEQMYAEVDEELAVFRGIFFFLPWQPAFYDNSKLQQQLRKEIDTQMLERIAAGCDQHRQLAVGATNLDLGKLEIFSMGREAKDALSAAREAGADSEDEAARFQDRFERILLASAAIPGAFEPVEIDDTLYADGGASEQFFGGIRASTLGRALQIDRERFPGASTPAFRVWVIINGKIGLQPEITQPRWTAVAFRSLQTMLSASTQQGLRRLELGSYLVEMGGAARLDFRYIALADDFPIEASSNLFDRDLMRALFIEGKRMGQDPTSWKSPARRPIVPGEFERGGSGDF